jgi:micrococcal nuclease
MVHDKIKNMRFFSFSSLIFVFFLFPVVDQQYFRVVRVLDGDTIEIIDDKEQTTRIRLEGIDAPEKSQPFGQKSKDYLSSWVASKYVSIKVKEKDKYGRTIATVYLPGDSTMSVNQRMVEAGFAWHYKQYSDDPTLMALELSARKRKIGLWADPNPEAPWEFRKKKKSP